MINFHELKTSGEDVTIIAQIAKRAAIYMPTVPKIEFAMDLEVCHAFNPLDLRRLLGADDGNFVHDVFGIMRHLDRDTGKLRDCFSPRYTRRRPTAPKPGRRWPLLREA